MAHRIPVFDSDPRLGRAYIGDPPPAYATDITALHVTSPYMRVDATAAAIRFNPRNAEYSLFFILGKIAGDNEVIIDVTTGGTSGWTTPGGLNTDYTLPGSDGDLALSWLLHVDHRHLTVSVVPGDASVLVAVAPRVEVEDAATHTFADADNDRTFRCTHASGCVVTVPAGLTPGKSARFIAEDTDNPVSVVGSGLTLRYDTATFSAATAAQYSSLVITILDSDEALVEGDLAPA